MILDRGDFGGVILDWGDFGWGDCGGVIMSGVILFGVILSAHQDIQVLPVVVILVHPHNNSKVDMPKGQEHLLPKGEGHMDLLLQALSLKLNDGLMQLIKIEPD